MADESNAQPAPEAELSPAPPQASALGIFSNLFFEPRAAFQALNRKPRWLLAIALMIIVGAIFNVILIQKIGIETMLRMSMEASAKSGQNVDPAEVAHRLSENPIVRTAFYTGPLIGPLLLPLLFAAIFTGIFSLFDLGGGFKKIYSVTAHAMAAHSVVVSGLSSLIIALKDDYQGIDLTNPIMSNLGFLVEAGTPHPGLRSLLASLDIFSIWLLFLWTVGFTEVLPRTSMKKTAVTVISLWALYVLGKAAWAALFSR